MEQVKDKPIKLERLDRNKNHWWELDKDFKTYADVPMEDYRKYLTVINNFHCGRHRKLKKLKTLHEAWMNLSPAAIPSMARKRNKGSKGGENNKTSANEAKEGDTRQQEGRGRGC